MTRRSGIMLCYPFELRRLQNEVRGQFPWRPPYLLQPKLDGERCRAVVGMNNTVYLWSSEQNLITSVPHINEALEDMCLPLDLEFDGELYIHEETFGDLHSIISQKNQLADNYDLMEYHIFDIIDETMTQLERSVHLSRFRFHSPLFHVKNTMIDTIGEVLQWIDNYTDRGYEGIILRELSAMYVRKRSSAIMKFKPKKSDYYLIVGVEQEISVLGHPKPSLGALVCISDEGTSFNVGSGFTQDQRRQWWLERDILIGRTVHVQYQNINPEGAPRFPVFLSLNGEG